MFTANLVMGMLLLCFSAQMKRKIAAFLLYRIGLNHLFVKMTCKISFFPNLFQVLFPFLFHHEKNVK